MKDKVIESVIEIFAIYDDCVQLIDVYETKKQIVINFLKISSFESEKYRTALKRIKRHERIEAKKGKVIKI